MSTKFFPNLIQDYVKLLEDGKFYDVIIYVGKESNVKSFRAHMNILCSRSSYLHQILTSPSKKNRDGVNIINFPNISPEIFQIIIKFIYSGVLLLNEKSTLDVFKLLVAADKLRLQELVDYLQVYLTENKTKWLEQNFDLIYRKSFQYNFLELRRSCVDLMAKSPRKIFRSFDFATLPENVLIQLIKGDDLQMTEIEVWEHVLKWGLARNPKLKPNPETWTDQDFKKMEATLKNCLPLIRFFNFTPKEFSEKVRPYQKLLKRELYDELLNSYLDPNHEPEENIPPPRNIKIDGIIDSKIVNLNIVSIISKRIDKMDINSKFAYFRELHLPYKFDLLLRGSRDGFTPKKFHELCNDRPNTVVFIKVKETGEILGGYNPLEWKSTDNFGRSDDSFIFSFKNENSFKDLIISNVKETDYALRFHPNGGPYFGQDLVIHSSDELADYDKAYYMHNHYEKRIRVTEGKFTIEDYEVFQLSFYELEENNKNNFEILRELAENGDSDAQYRLAYCYNKGIGTEVDNAKAFEIYKQLAEKGDLDSMFNLAYCYKNGIGTEVDNVKTFELCKKLSKRGNDTAQNNLGVLYLEGDGTKRNIPKAIHWFQKASEQGNKLAQDNLGICYELGVGIEKDEAKAFDLYKKSAENGYVNAKFHLGYCYVNGIGTEIDEARGIEFYNVAAKQGGNTKELKEVCHWYEQATENDSKVALYKLGEFYEIGKGVNKNGFRAFDYYRQSAEKGYIIGVYKLGNLYEHGIGTFVSKAKAFALYKSAAEGGYSIAQKVLGNFYEQGEGIDKDAEKAIYWYKEAVKNGCLQAEEDLNNLILKNDYVFF